MRDEIAKLLAECETNFALREAFGTRLEALMQGFAQDSIPPKLMLSADKLIKEIGHARATWTPVVDVPTGRLAAKDASLDALYAAADLARPEPMAQRPSSLGVPKPAIGGQDKKAAELAAREERRAQELLDKLDPLMRDLKSQPALVDAVIYQGLVGRFEALRQGLQAKDFSGLLQANRFINDVQAALLSRKTERFEDVYEKQRPGHEVLAGEAETLRKYSVDPNLAAHQDENARLVRLLNEALAEVSAHAERARGLLDEEREAAFKAAVEGDDAVLAAAQDVRRAIDLMNKAAKVIEGEAQARLRRKTLLDTLPGLKSAAGDTLQLVEQATPARLQEIVALLVPGKDDGDLAAQMTQARVNLLQAALTSPTACAKLANKPASANVLVLAAEGLRILTPEMLDCFGDKAPQMCRNFAIEIAKRKPAALAGEGGAADARKASVLEDWVWAKADPADWNRRENGTSAQVFNSLWNARNYEQMAQLIARKFDAGQAFNTEKDDGRGSREGVWSGFVQPLEHLMGNYVKRVHLAGLPLDQLDDQDRAAIGEPSQELAALAEKVRRAEQQAARLAGQRDLLPQGEAATSQQRAQRKDLEARIAELGKLTLSHGQKNALKDLAGLKAKVAGARQLLQALEKAGDTSIATSYASILESPLIQLMSGKNNFGTIWGFEDVRLPYVQAAREATPHGAKALRMWEMWKAIDLAINEEGYDRLLADPDKTIPAYIAKGSEALDAEIAKNPEVYRGADVDVFKANFARQAESYLRHLASRTPKGEFDTAEASGLAPTKLMGALGCKAGLWWAKEQGEKVYYCLDGLRIEQAVDYKKQKNDGINKHLLLEGPLFLEVITFEEVREILKNWDKGLSGTVIFTRKGQVVDPVEVRKWITLMQQNDALAGKRPAPLKAKIAAQLDALSPHLKDDAEVSDQLGLKLVIKANTLVRVAKMRAQGVLLPYLTDKCQLLFDHGVLPWGLTMLYAGMLNEQDASYRAIQHKTLGRLIELIINPKIKAALKARMVEQAV